MADSPITPFLELSKAMGELSHLLDEKGKKAMCLAQSGVDLAHEFSQYLKDNPEIVSELAKEQVKLAPFINEDGGVNWEKLKPLLDSK